MTLTTGTGKTFIAFQIVHKVFQARWNQDAVGSRRPRVLFLADRNILADQAINTFNPYEKDLVKIDGEEVRNVVLDRSIGSMVEFKQIVGRGTRVFDGKGADLI